MSKYTNPPRAVIASYGCTLEFWHELRRVGQAMVAKGASQDTTPLRAFGHQRNAAVRRRGIEWHLTLEEWWSIWTESGHWHERGVGRGYMMCRKGDKGPYAIGNVFIGTGVDNLSAAAKKHDLPIGVSLVAKGRAKPYRAYCNIGGKQRHIGLYATPEDAHQAYLAARLSDEASRDRDLSYIAEAA